MCRTTLCIELALIYESHQVIGHSSMRYRTPKTHGMAAINSTIESKEEVLVRDSLTYVSESYFAVESLSEQPFFDNRSRISIVRDALSSGTKIWSW